MPWNTSAATATVVLEPQPDQSSTPVTETALPPEWEALSGHPTDSSRQLLALLALWRHSSNSSPKEDAALAGILSAGVLRNLLAALQVRDGETLAHCRRVSMWAGALGRKLGLDEFDLKLLELAGLVHELGKIGVPDHLLHKPATLSPDEQELFSLYYRIGLNLLQACRADVRLVEVLADSRVYYNGINDSFRKVGSQISLGGRILALVDAYDSLRSEKPYRPARTHESAIQLLMEKSGTQFDGTLVDCLSRIVPEITGPSYETTSGNGAEMNHLPPQEALAATALCQILGYLHQLETLYDGFYILDSDLRYVVWNQGLEQMLGITASERIGTAWNSQEPEWAGPRGEPLAEENSPVRLVLNSGKPWAGTLRVQNRNGMWREVETLSLPLRDAHGKLQGVAEILRDSNRVGNSTEQYRDLKMQATVDALTGVANRGELQTQLTQMLKQRQEGGDQSPLSVIFLDVDHFKSVNDSFGHSVGDKVLISLSKLLQHELYSGEFIGRYGGEEFVVLCPETDLPTAFNRAERLRSAAEKISAPEMKGRKITISLGVSQFIESDVTASLLERADQALYTSKQKGRNQTNTLMPEDLAARAAAEAAAKAADPWTFRDQFRAVVTNDVVIYKLGGYVKEQNAKLMQVTEKTASLQIGQAGFFGGWGSTDDRQPVQVELEFQPLPASQNCRSSTQKREIHVTVKPLGRIKDSEIFQSRAYRLFKTLKSYFAADED